MMDVFDRLGETLNDMIGGHGNNSVGWAADQLFAQPQGFSEGGVVGDSNDFGSYVRGIGQAASSTFKKSDPMGAGFYSSPAYIAHSMTNLGKFFNVSDPNNMNVHRFNTGDVPAGRNAKAENPDDFYAKWYMGMRRFAEAAEVASRGQAGIRRA